MQAKCIQGENSRATTMLMLAMENRIGGENGVGDMYSGVPNE
jgi:hypothetical protein